ncbi:trafficking protein particle complex subunit 10 [Clonorchis sinensis]|uniref:Trafficking protein particle complex subunit 10 n=1 Tax=Clonorchis sinensis TaxID=79923 RepID=H2KSQ9_CLOSI|nr:trafficking protein particle complex subunit 10 [Clonorchis sinensis]
MDPIPRPVISCYGHEGLVSELEQRCLQTIASEPALWRHSKHVAPYPVRIDAYFTRFNLNQLQSTVKVLSSGRPTRPLGSMNPMLYVYVVSNNATQYTTGGVRQKLASWLGHLQAGNISDWVVLMIDADQNSSKMWQKTSVLDQIKRDFRVPNTTTHFLQLPDRRAVEEKVFLEAWTAFLRSFRKMILTVYQSTIEDYENHLQLLQEAQGTPGWEFFEYLERREELAQLYLTVNGLEDTLQQYYAIESLFASAIRAVASRNDEHLPGWVKNLKSHGTDKESCSFLCYYPWVNSRIHPQLLELLQNRFASVFDIRNYLLSRECGLLKAYSRAHDIPSRALLHIRHGLEESEILKLYSSLELNHLWAFLCALNCLNVLRPSTGPAADEITDSVASVLSNAFRPFSTKGSSVVQSLESEDGLLRTQSSNNAFLRDMSELSPALASLAATVQFLYRFIIVNVPTLSEKPQAIIPLGELPIRVSHAVDLWLMAFIELTHIGRVLALWTATDEVNSSDSIIQLIKVSVFQCFASDLTDQTLFGRSVHKQLGVLLTSPALYEEVYVAMAQTLIGFLRLIHEPRRTPFVCCLLADFMRTRHIFPRAIELYSIVLSIYLRDGWSLLTVLTCLLLACCLRTFLEDTGAEDASPVGYLTRYSDCCLLLSCAKTTELQLANGCLARSAPKSAKRLELSLTELSVPTEDLLSSEFWWFEAVKSCHQLTDDTVFDASCSLSSPFSIDFAELNGASNNGYQLITIGLRVNADVHFKVSVHVGGTKPEAKDWETVMRYGVVREQWPPQFSSNLPKAEPQTTELRSGTPPTGVVKSASGSPVLKSKFTHSRSFAHLFRKDATSIYHSTESVGRVHMGSAASGTRDIPRKISLLDTVASLASRPTWISQEGMHVVRLSRTSSFDSSVGQSTHEQALHVGVDDALTKLRREAQPPHRPASFQIGQGSWPPSTLAEDADRCHSTEEPTIDCSTLESESDACFLRPLVASSISTFDVSFSTVQSADDSPFVLLQPGLNKIQLTANCRGFFLPKKLFLTIVDREKTSDCNEPATSSPSFLNANSSFKMCYDIRASDFSVTWTDQQLLDYLLPTVCMSSAFCDKTCTISVILGLRQTVPIVLQPGKLGLPTNNTTGVTLYRLLPNICQNTLSSQTKGKLGPSDYIVTSPTKQKPDSDSQQPLPYPYDYQDGPVSVEFTQTNSENTDPPSSAQLSRPLWMTPITDSDEFFLAMPSGYLCRLPVKVIRPFVIMLNIYTIHPSDAVVFAIRIACKDIPEQRHSAKRPLKPTPDKPLTFLLSQFQFMITAPTAQDNFSAPSSRKGSTVETPMFSVPASLVSSRKGSILHMNVAETQIPDLSDCMFANPVDPRCTRIEVNRLCPVNLLFRVKFSEFRPFVKSLLKRFGHSPVARFSCAFSFADDPDYEAQLTFSRAISPVRQRVPEKLKAP